MATGRPRGRPRKNPLIASEPVIAAVIEPEPATEIASIEAETPQVPADWHVGMLLNVRPTGEGWNITLFPEEYDPRHPERTLQFTNYGKCQDFVSTWYARQAHDPRAR